MTVLYVDDDFDDIQLFSDALKVVIPHGKCLPALSGVDALQILRTTRPLPDHVVLDYNMPSMSGLECIGEIKADYHLSDLPLTVLSTSCNDKEVTLIKEYGVECHKKPNSFEELTHIVSQILF